MRMTSRLPLSDGQTSVAYASGSFAADMGVHEIADALCLRPADVWIIGLNVAHPLLVDGVRPFGPEEVGHRQVHEQAAERGRIQHAGIVEGGEMAHAQYPKPSS